MAPDCVFDNVLSALYAGDLQFQCGRIEGSVGQDGDVNGTQRPEKFAAGQLLSCKGDGKLLFGHQVVGRDRH
jgi:hypothetical protein